MARRVNFRDVPAGDGGGSSSGHNSDSGVGTLSDGASHSNASTTTYAFAAPAGSSAWNDLDRLREAYRNLAESKARWKSKVQVLDDEVVQSRKSLKEVEAKWRAMISANDQLQEDKKKLLHDRKDALARAVTLRDENEVLRRQLADANAYIQRLREGSAGPAAAASRSSSAHPDPDPAARIHRSGSRKEKEKDRLSRRFDRVDDSSLSSGGSGGGNHSDRSSARPSSSSRMGPPPPPPPPAAPASSSSSQKQQQQRSRRHSYVEPFGPAGPTPPMAAGRTQSFAAVTEASYGAPAFAQAQAPTYSSIPRSVRPSVVVEDPFSPQAFVEDGHYHAYPLPTEGSHRRRPSRG